MSDQLQYQFKFVKLITQEFALVENNFVQGEEINVAANLHWGADGNKHIIGVASKFLFEIKKQAFIIIKVEGQFHIEDVTWDRIYQEENNKLILDKSFMAHLAMLVVGSTRGVLHSKLENTPFNQMILPTINVQSMIKEDVIIDLTKAK